MLFNKPNPDSKVERDSSQDTKYGLASLRIIAKNTLTFKTLARDLKTLNNAFSNYVKLHNIRPAEGQRISDVTKSLSESKEIKIAKVRVQKERKEKGRTFLASFVDKVLNLLFAALVGTLLSVGYVVYKLTEIITPYVTDFFEKVVEGFTFFSEAIYNFVKETDFSDLFLTSFKKYLGFLSFGLITEQQVDSVISQTGSFYKSMIRGLGGFIKDAINWLAPKLQSIGRYIGKDILGVDIDKLQERRSIKEVLVKQSQELQREYDELDKQDKELTGKKSKLLEIKNKLQEKEKEKAKPPAGKKEEAKPTPTPAPAPAQVKKEEKKVEPKVDVKKVPPSNGTAAPLPEPAKPPTAEKKKEETAKDGSGDAGMKYQEGSNVVKIISKYGMRQLPTEKEPRLHAGIDYGAALATPITFTGTMAKVVMADAKTGYGRTIDLSVDGEILRFAHLSKMLVKQGDKVENGMTIGLVGGSSKDKQGNIKENAYGPHLHFEHRSSSSFSGKDTYDPVKSGAVKLVGFGDKIAASDYSLTEKYANYKGEYGEGLSTESSKLALAYREQSKPKNPTYVDARTVNNNVVQTNKNIVPAKA